MVQLLLLLYIVHILCIHVFFMLLDELLSILTVSHLLGV